MALPKLNGYMSVIKDVVDTYDRMTKYQREDLVKFREARLAHDKAVEECRNFLNQMSR